MRKGTTIAVAVLLLFILGAAALQLFVLRDSAEPTCVRTSVPGAPTTLSRNDLPGPLRNLPECKPTK
ncbi:MAG: hypothetical protein AB7L13_02940 [Acidimicrobiia bacterium]